MHTRNGSNVDRQAIRNRLAAERSYWEALVAEVDPAWASEPNAMGDWSFKDVVAHIAAWRQRFVNELVAAVQGTPKPELGWPHTAEETEDGSPQAETRLQAVNDWMYERSRDRTYDQVLAEASLQWTTIQAAVDLMSDDLLQRRDAIAMLNGESIAASLLNPDTFSHLREEHEPQIREWLARRRDPAQAAPSDDLPQATCIECGGVIEQDDIVCPHCGISLVAG
jgi:rubrerythrin